MDCASNFHREHSRLGAGVGEADPLEIGDPFAEHPRELDLILRRHEPAGSPLDGCLQRLDDRGEGVAVDQAEPVVREVDVAVAVEVDQVGALAAGADDRIRRW